MSKHVLVWSLVAEAFHLHYLVTLLRQVTYADQMYADGGGGALDRGVLESLHAALLGAVEPLDRLGLTASKNLINDFRIAIESGHIRTAYECQQRSFHCFKVLQCDCEHVECVRVDLGKKSVVDGLESYIHDRFPKAVSELREAEQCVFHERPTACVFHLMRACEIILKAVWKTLAWYPPKQSDSWGALLGNLDEQLKKPPIKPSPIFQSNIPFFSEIVFDLRSAKRCYRDSTMHVESTHIQADAEAILGAVLTLVRHAAMELDQDGNVMPKP